MRFLFSAQIVTDPRSVVGPVPHFASPGERKPATGSYWSLELTTKCNVASYSADTDCIVLMLPVQLCSCLLDKTIFTSSTMFKDLSYFWH